MIRTAKVRSRLAQFRVLPSSPRMIKVCSLGGSEVYLYSKRRETLLGVYYLDRQNGYIPTYRLGYEGTEAANFYDFDNYTHTLYPLSHMFMHV